MLNALPLLTSWLREKQIDPYQQLCAWADWLAFGAGVGSNDDTMPTLDTINEFLNFAEGLHSGAASKFALRRYPSLGTN